MKPTILIVDNEPGILAQARLSLEAECEILTTSNEAAAMQNFAASHPPVVILNLTQDGPGHFGMRLLADFIRQSPATRIIVITGCDEENKALLALRLGASDCYSGPIQIGEFETMIRRALRMHALLGRIHSSGEAENDDFHGMIGTSGPMLEILRVIEEIAASESAVLICGENGTGRELAARAIHRLSRRRNGPFTIVDCTAMPQSVAEGELFGHPAVFFAGAYSHTGRFDLAQGGTLFLAEAADLSPAVQTTLLRLNQARDTESLGKFKATDPDVRIIATTSRDSKSSVEVRTFFEERLKARILEMPALRQRKKDLVRLARYFVAKACRELRKPLLTLSLEAQGALLMHSWPGNVRELEATVKRAVTLCPRAILSPSDFGFALSSSIQNDVNLKFAKKAIEADFIKKALLKNNGVVSRAAKDLGISRVNLYDLMDRYSIQIQDFKIRSTDRQHAKQPEVI